MKKMKFALVAALGLSMAACGAAPKEEEPAEDLAQGVYQVYNVTGETVTELYIHLADEEEGTNYADGGMEDGANVEIKIDAAEDAVLCLDFVTESGYEGQFNTLHIEEAPISLISADAMTGATEISFTAPEE